MLSGLLGPLRVGACTVDASIPLPDWGMREVTVHWPALGQGVDAVVLVHSGTLTASIRSRMTAGLGLILVAESLNEETHRRLRAELGPETLMSIRTRQLSDQLHILASRYPDVADELRAIAGYCPPVVASSVARVAVIGPEPATREVAVTELVDGGMDVVDSADVDVAVAVAPRSGWSAADTPTLADAAQRAGRLVSTAPLPAGVDGVFFGHDSSLIDAVSHSLAHPRVLPATRPAAWAHATAGMERRRRVQLNDRLSELLILARKDEGSAISGLAATARECGVESEITEATLSVNYPAVLWPALLIGGMSGLTAGRSVWSIHPVAGLVAGLVALTIVGCWRWRIDRREARLRCLEQEVDRLRRSPLLMHAVRAGPVSWLRRELDRAGAEHTRRAEG